MRQLSELYTSILNAGYSVETAVEIAGVTYYEKSIAELTTSHGIFSEGYPQVGCCISGEIALKLKKPETDIPRQAQIKPFVRITDGENYSEWVQKGVYYIDTRETEGSAEDIQWLSISGYDALIFADEEYPSITDGWPESGRRDLYVVNIIAEALGISVDARTTQIMEEAYSAGKSYAIPLPSGYTIREILSYIGASYGGSFVLSDLGELRLIQLSSIQWNAGNGVEVGKHVTAFEEGPLFDRITRINLQISDELQYTSGGDTGRSLALFTPWGSQTMCDNLLSQFSWYRYQPYSASGAIIHPGVELGDSVSVCGTRSGICKMDTKYGHLYSADIAAPHEEEIGHEIPYKSKSERTYERSLRTTKSELTAQLQVQAGLISAKVSSVSEHVSETGTVAWEIVPTKFSISAALGTETPVEVFKVTKSGLVVNGSGTFSGKIIASEGEIGGFSIYSDRIVSNGMTWGSTDIADGIYLGTQYGLKIGQNFKVTLSGSLYASDGWFAGTVRASQIVSGSGTVGGQTGGYFNGSGLTAYSVTTGKTSEGINISLGYADFANGVFGGWNTAAYVKTNSVTAQEVSIGELSIRGYRVSLSTITYENASGETITENVLTWS